jgi:hypothetical protein
MHTYVKSKKPGVKVAKKVTKPKKIAKDAKKVTKPKKVVKVAKKVTKPKKVAKAAKKVTKPKKIAKVAKKVTKAKKVSKVANPQKAFLTAMHSYANSVKTHKALTSRKHSSKKVTVKSAGPIVQHKPASAQEIRMITNKNIKDYAHDVLRSFENNTEPLIKRAISQTIAQKKQEAMVHAKKVSKLQKAVAITKKSAPTIALAKKWAAKKADSNLKKSVATTHK